MQIFNNQFIQQLKTSFEFRIMATQKQIDDLLNDQWDQQSKSKSKITEKSTITVVKPVEQKQNNYEQSYSYANDEFQDYEQSRRTQSIQQSYSQSVPQKPANKPKEKQKEKQKNKQLASIKQQQFLKPPQKQNKKTEAQKNKHYIKPALQLKTESAFGKKTNQASTLSDKQYLPHNYARLQERQKQLLLTTLTEDNKRLKAELLQQANNYKKLQTKYNMLLQQKAEHTSTAKQLALEKQVTNLKTRLQQMSNLQKIAEDREKYKTKISKNPGNFLPEEEVERRQAQLLQLIDKLKHRLLQSDENMTVLQKKLNQGVQHNDELHRKMKRVQQLQYRIEKMTEQAETDRGYIDILKQKIKQLEKQVEGEKNRFKKQQIEMKRLYMGQLTHSDILKQLAQVRKQKQLLQKSLKQMSSAMMNNVRKNFQGSANNIEDSQELLKVNKR